MPTASATSPMMPPRAATSRTRWPLATPPTAGLQLICAIRSRFMVMRAVLRPIRAAAIAASHPACPAPTTATSYCSVNAIQGYSTDYAMMAQDGTAGVGVASECPRPDRVEGACLGSETNLYRSHSNDAVILL